PACPGVQKRAACCVTLSVAPVRFGTCEMYVYTDARSSGSMLRYVCHGIGKARGVRGVSSTCLPSVMMLWKTANVVPASSRNPCVAPVRSADIERVIPNCAGPVGPASAAMSNTRPPERYASVVILLVKQLRSGFVWQLLQPALAV